MSARSGSYATRSTTEGIEELSKKLTLDLKKTIRQLVRSHRGAKFSDLTMRRNTAKFSVQTGGTLRTVSLELPMSLIWYGRSPMSPMHMGDNWTQEKTLPRTSEEATLWEGEELALRYLLEDGKLNL